MFYDDAAGQYFLDGGKRDMSMLLAFVMPGGETFYADTHFP